MFQPNPWSGRGAFLIILLQGNEDVGSVHDFILSSVFGVNQEKWGAEGVQDSPMAESFSTDLPAIESYWIESHLELCRTSMMELLCESMWGAFR